MGFAPECCLYGELMLFDPYAMMVCSPGPFLFLGKNDKTGIFV
jgi:hypothetical protein